MTEQYSNDGPASMEGVVLVQPTAFFLDCDDDHNDENTNPGEKGTRGRFGSNNDDNIPPHYPRDNDCHGQFFLFSPSSSMEVPPCSPTRAPPAPLSFSPRRRLGNNHQSEFQRNHKIRRLGRFSKHDSSSQLFFPILPPATPPRMNDCESSLTESCASTFTFTSTSTTTASAATGRINFPKPKPIDKNTKRSLVTPSKRDPENKNNRKMASVPMPSAIRLLPKRRFPPIAHRRSTFQS